MYKRKKPSFNKILLASIDEALSSLGENVAQSIYFHIEQKFKIKKQEIPNRIDDFSWALTQIFGLGARFLEIMFMKHLHSKIGSVTQATMRELAGSEVTFKEYIRLMRKKYGDNMNLEKTEFLINECEAEQHRISR